MGRDLRVSVVWVEWCERVGFGRTGKYLLHISAIMYPFAQSLRAERGKWRSAAGKRRVKLSVNRVVFRIGMQQAIWPGRVCSHLRTFLSECDRSRPWIHFRTSLRRVRSGGALTTNPPSVYSDVVACIAPVVWAGF